jgi:hypothetical protein
LRLQELLFVFPFLIASPSWADETQLQGGVSGHGSVSSGATATGDEFYRETDCGRALLRVSAAGVHGVGSFLGFTAQAEGQSAGAYMYSSGEAYFVPFSEMQKDGYPESPEYRFIFDHLSTEADQTVYIRSQCENPDPTQFKVDDEFLAYSGFPLLAGHPISPSDHVAQRQLLSALKRAVADIDDQLGRIRRALARAKERSQASHITLYSEMIEAFPGQVTEALCVCQQGGLHDLAEIIEQTATSIEGVSHPLNCE